MNLERLVSVCTEDCWRIRLLWKQTCLHAKFSIHLLHLICTNIIITDKQTIKNIVVHCSHIDNSCHGSIKNESKSWVTLQGRCYNCACQCPCKVQIQWDSRKLAWENLTFFSWTHLHGDFGIWICRCANTLSENPAGSYRWLIIWVFRPLKMDIRQRSSIKMSLHQFVTI